MAFDILPDSDDEEIPDWMKESSGEDVPTDPETDKGLDAAGISTPGEEATDFPAQESDEVPDWLNSIRETEAEDQDASDASKSESSQEDEEESSWLDDIRSKEEDRVATNVDESIGDGDFIDRIRGLQTDAEVIASDAPKIDDELVDGILSESKELEEPAEETPDWLSGLAPESSSPESTTPFEDPQKLPRSGFADTGSLPSWLVQMKQTGALELPEVQAGSGTPALSDDSSSSSDGIEVPDLDLSLGELPDWISNPSDDDELAQEFPYQEEAVSGNLEEDSGDVPDWVQGMRPTEVPAPDEKVESGVEETMGPLAGLYNLIPAEPEIGQFVKPPVFSLNLDVTESQKTNASLFEHIATATPPQGKAAMVARLLTVSVLRWAISILVLLAIAVPVLASNISTAFPSSQPPVEIFDLHSKIKELNQDDVVLLAFDFQPGSYAEMSSASSAIIDHILSKGSKLVLMSTNPTGTATGELFLSKTQAAHSYIEDRAYQNLKFLSGGSSGLQNLATVLRNTMPQTIVVDDVEKSIWNSGPLQTVYSLNDFKLLLVLTDEIETARNWIEQVRPSLENTSLLLITNAQTDPLIRPYYSSEPKQLDGFVAGMLGGAYYEQINDREHVAREYWSSYSSGLGMISSLVIFGSVFGVIANVLARRTSRPKESKL